MKVIHVPFCFYPDPAGGTEVYVNSLAKGLIALGHEALIAAPAAERARYDHEGVSVIRYPVSEKVNDLRELYGDGAEGAAHEFGGVLDEERPDVLHLHAFTRGVSLRLVREARRRKVSTVFTYHTPTVSCQRGTLLRWGQELCDGVLDSRTCARCALHGLGMSRMQSAVLVGLPLAGRIARLAGLSGGLWTGLRMSELVELRQDAYRTLMNEVDRVVALCDWVKNLLHRNGTANEKIVVSRHGLPAVSRGEERTVSHSGRPDEGRGRGSKLKIAFLGRFDSTKGPDILLRALRLIPGADVELHLYGIVQDTAADAYWRRLKDSAADDPRIVFKPPVPSGQVVALLKSYDLLAVPSQWLETGPLVVLEAFAAGIPVIGSNLGGIAELVRHETDGLLVETASAEGWAAAIQRCAADGPLLDALRRGVRPPRDMGAVAREMSQVYEQILAAGQRPSDQVRLREGTYARG